MGTTQSSVQAESLDVGAAEQAFNQLLPELQALPAHRLQPVRVELQLTAAIAYSVAQRDQAEARRNQLALVSQGTIFSLAILDRLPTIALAAWHARRKQVEAVAAASSARVPEDTLKEAQATRTRMLRVLTHYFEDHPEHGKRVTMIRAGSGYLDLANDLLSLAECYETPDIKSVVSQDPMHYRNTDPATARQLAQQLFHCLGLTSEGEATRWTDLAQRAWTLLLQNYEALQAAGQLVFRNAENVEVSYPSLVTAVRAAPTRISPQPSPATPNPQAPSPQPATSN